MASGLRGTGIVKLARGAVLALSHCIAGLAPVLIALAPGTHSAWRVPACDHAG